MACWKVTITGKGIRKASVDKLVQKMKEEFGKDCHLMVKDATPPESRSDRFNAALSLVGDAKEEISSLHDELQDWLESLPENLQSGGKADELQTAIDELDRLQLSLEDVEGVSVEFPGMFS